MNGRTLEFVPLRPSEPDSTGQEAPGNAKEWEIWARHLARRSKPVSLVTLAGQKGGSPLAWALPDELAGNDTARLIDRLDRAGEGKKSRRGDFVAEEMEPWLAEAADRPVDAGYALECLAWCHALRRLAESAAPALWWELFSHLQKVTQEAVTLCCGDRPLVQQMLAGELPLALGYLFPEVASCDGMARAARGVLSEGIIEILDGEGLPHSRYLELLRPLWACWTRAALLGSDLKKGSFTNDAQIQYEWIVRKALGLTRYDGSQMLASGSAGAWCKGLFDTALKLSGDPDDWAIAAAVLPSFKSHAREESDDVLPLPAIESEWSEMALLRPDWSRRGARLVVTYGGRRMVSELACGEAVVWSGSWDPEITVDGQRLGVTADIEEVCWFSDDDVDYLELEIVLTRGWRIQRHILMGREDGFLFLADAVLGEETGQIDYRCRLPLTEDIGFEAADETREGFLRGKRRLASVMPLALPEWRTDRRCGELTMTENGLELAQSAQARRMFAPLLLDLKPGRLKKPLTWRQLTIAEQMEILPAETVVGYRVQVGSRHWLIYRSLAAPANRTVLGQNLTEEFVVARFNRYGEIEPLVEVEQTNFLVS